MREILFRAKDKDNGEWVYGYYAHFETIREVLYVIYTDCVDDYSVGLLANYSDVKPETVGQFTGLTDKNCVKVFEGDIVRIFDGEYFSGVVKYSNEQGSFTVDDTSLHYWVSDIEVIGNVHDNPELLQD